ncbi:MAG: hypothetical protein JOZ83_17900 [Silvibacterium sp.]|nr:hypothetical protein [Silvibacterium sp.]
MLALKRRFKMKARVLGILRGSSGERMIDIPEAERNTDLASAKAMARALGMNLFDLKRAIA